MRLPFRWLPPLILIALSASPAWSATFDHDDWDTLLSEHVHWQRDPRSGLPCCRSQHLRRAIWPVRVRGGWG